MTQLAPARPGAGRIAMGGDLATLVLLVLVVPLALPYALIAAVGGGLVRTVYPAYILLAALMVVANRRPYYPAFMLAVFAFTPFLRRVADYQAGFAVFNLILLAPYVGLVPTLPSLLRRALNGGPALGWPFAAITGCVVYAAFLALFQLAFVPAIYEAMRWLLPTALCAYIMARPAEAASVQRAVIRALCLIVPILTLYGIYQFQTAPLWDVYWMWNIDNATFGLPEAFKIRVFSMMNSPGTVGVFVSYALILLAGDGLVPLAIAATGLPLLALTLIRTAWLSAAIGLVVLFLLATGRRRLTLLAGVCAIAIAAAGVIASPALPPEIRTLVTDRFATFSNVDTDASAADRLSIYDAFFARFSDSPWGEGFGANASTVTTHETKRSLASIDSGLMETYLIFGALAGTLYFAALAMLVIQAWSVTPRTDGRLNAHFAVVCAMIAIMPLGSNHIAEPGILVWIALGIIFADAQAMSLRRR